MRVIFVVTRSGRRMNAIGAILVVQIVTSPILMTHIELPPLQAVMQQLTLFQQLTRLAMLVTTINQDQRNTIDAQTIIYQ